MLTDEELCRNVYQSETSTELERELVNRLTKALDTITLMESLEDVNSELEDKLLAYEAEIIQLRDALDDIEGIAHDSRSL
jgi:hypothetical protein